MLKKTLTIAAFSTLAPLAAQAAVISIEGAPDGSAFSLSRGDQYTGEAVADGGGAGSYTLTFNATEDPLFGRASVSLNSADVMMFDDVVVSWLDADDDRVLNASPVTILPGPGGDFGVLNLATVFSGDALGQKLRFEWSDAEEDAAFDFDVVAAVPVPASIWLFGAALGGLGLLRRRGA